MKLYDLVKKWPELPQEPADALSLMSWPWEKIVFLQWDKVTVPHARNQMLQSSSRELQNLAKKTIESALIIPDQKEVSEAFHAEARELLQSFRRHVYWQAMGRKFTAMAFSAAAAFIVGGMFISALYPKTERLGAGIITSGCIMLLSRSMRHKIQFIPEQWFYAAHEKCILNEFALTMRRGLEPRNIKAVLNTDAFRGDFSQTVEAGYNAETAFIDALNKYTGKYWKENSFFDNKPAVVAAQCWPNSLSRLVLRNLQTLKI